MCGIAGSFSKKALDQDALRQATDALLHRGPDAGGYFTNAGNTAFLGHRRLSIIDLSGAANQPMHSSCQRYTMVYNGEVYNYQDLKSRLPGHPWKTHSDTEVILELFAAFGSRSFAWLNGMFALAIYDNQSDQLTICRDQAGIKPLFYFWDKQVFVFGSELKSVKKFLNQTGIPVSVNKAAVPAFLHLGYIPGPSTIFQHLYKFPPGSTAQIRPESTTLSIQPFWNPEDHFKKKSFLNEETAHQQYQELLFDAVKDQMVSDVPLGTFLSGGIDSSLVTAVASRLSSRTVKTFSIGFREARYDESPYAEAVAAHLKTDHHTFKVSVDEVLEMVPSLIQVYDEPFADSSAFPTMLVSRLARQQVTVVLSGDGGDELFQGYGMYTWANRLHHPLLRALRQPAYQISRLMNNRIKRAGQIFNYPSPDRIHSHIFSQEQYLFSEQELADLMVHPDFDFTALNHLASVPTPGNAAEVQALWDFKNYLLDDLLVKVDRASMKYSLETRVPLLDLRLVEFSLSLPYQQKVSKEYGTKHLMKKTLYQMVPRTLFERPKRGFAIPLKEWLKGPLNYLIRDYLNHDMIKKAGFIKPEKRDELLDRFNKGEDYLYNRIWLLIVLHWWLEENQS